MSCENEKWKWHLNSLFPCHRKTVGTKVHAFTSHVRVCESRAHHVFNQLAGGYSFASKAIVVEFACWNFLLPTAKKKQCGKFYLFNVQGSKVAISNSLCSREVWFTTFKRQT